MRYSRMGAIVCADQRMMGLSPQPGATSLGVVPANAGTHTLRAS